MQLRNLVITPWYLIEGISNSIEELVSWSTETRRVLVQKISEFGRANSLLICGRGIELYLC